MIYSLFLGGLGNCLFQIAAALSLGWDNQDEDVYFSSYSVSCTPRPEKEKIWYTTILKDIKQIANKPIIQYVYREPSLLYNKIPYQKNIELIGYFQNEKYFSKYKDKIINFFNDYKKNILNKLNLVLNQTSKPKIAIHVRRGDYLQMSDFHTILSHTDYYEKALNEISNKINIDDYALYIFSDDINWCNSWDLLKKYKDVYYISAEVDVHELYLMSLCEHNIIANSSFSWWGAYLNENKDKIVIYPSNKYYLGQDVKIDISCDGWTAIN